MSALNEVVIGPNVVTIPDKSFYASGVKNLSFSNATSLKTIGSEAFYNTKITEVVVPMGVTDIMSGAFRNCSSLKKACLYSRPTVASNAFSSWTELDYGENLTYNTWLAMYGSEKSNITDLLIPNDNISASSQYTSKDNLNTQFPNLKNVVFSDKVTTIGDNIFAVQSGKTNNLETVVFEGEPVAVGSCSFSRCSKLTTIEGKVKSVSNASFQGCSSLRAVELTDDTELECAFADCTSLQSIVLPNNLKTIVAWDFQNCTALTSITIPSSVTSVNKYSFWNCTNLKTVTINSASIANPSTAYTESSNLTTLFPNATEFKFGEGVSAIGKNALYGCARMTSLELPVSLTAVNDYAFYGCTGLTSVTLPKNLTNMSASAFSGCTNVTNLTIASNTIASKNWTSSSNMNTIFPNLQKVVFGKDVKALGANIFYMPTDKTNNIETIVFEGNPVDVGSSAFRYNTKLAKIGKVKSVGASSFSNCSSLESIEITGDDVVDGNAFAACSSLKSVTLPNTLTTINQYAFKDCIGLTSIEIPSNVTSINAEAFRTATNLSKVKISSASVVNPSTPYSETRNLGKIFPYATEVDLNLPMDNNNAIGNYAFYGATALKSVIRATKVTEIGANAFKGCTNLVLGDDRYFINTWGYVQTIGESAFEGCTSLKLDELTKNVTTINAAAFKGCTGLTSLILPEKLESMALDAFDGCTSLTDVTILSNAFAGKAWAVEDNIRTRFPYATDFTFGEKVTSIGDYAFAAYPNDNSNVKRVTFTSIPSIGEYAFCNGKNIESVTGSIKSVSQYSFAICRKLPSITITDDDVIEEWAFGQCSALKSVTLPDNLKELQYGAFLSCLSLAEIQLPSTVEKFQRAVFKGCTSLKEITLPATVSTFNAQVFMNCSNLAKVTVLNPTPVALTESMDVFNGISATAELNVPGSSLNAYKTAEVWKNFYSYFASDGIKLVDGEPYTRTVSEVVPMVRYTRTFSTSSVNNWLALCIPFSIDVVSDDYEIGKILTFCPMKDTNGDGTIDGNDDNYLVISPCKSGKTVANVPYMIKPKKSGDIVFTAENCTLHAANAGELHFSTTENSYDVYGLLQNSVVATVENQYYYMSATGKINHRTTGSTTVKPNRWYLTMSKKTYGSDEVDDMSSNAREIQIFTIGEDMDEATAIGIIEAGTGHKSEKASDNSIYTLSGMKVDNVDNLPAGIYVKNGKKFVVK
ncbi:MAG: leucine-rich repeat domain-containing protein [Prevotellaceae bacterium]|nr:leucine-rich repeat domain-containing protein [Prevotellaceae bacterium]